MNNKAYKKKIEEYLIPRIKEGIRSSKGGKYCLYTNCIAILKDNNIKGFDLTPVPQSKGNEVILILKSDTVSPIKIRINISTFKRKYKLEKLKKLGII